MTPDLTKSEWEAAKIVARLFHYLDGGDYKAVASLFATDGSWLRLGKQLTGPTEVEAALSDRPAGLVTRHLVTNLIVDANDAGVTASYYIAVFDSHSAGDGPAPLAAPAAIFVSEDRLVETQDGFRFAKRAPRLVFRRV